MSQMMHALPVDAYTSLKWFEHEQARIFSCTWRFAGFVEDLVKPGDYRVIQAGLNSLLVVKGPDQRLRAFHNRCRHRGTQLVPESGHQQQAFVCPYHHWAYDLAGSLVRVPEEADEFPGLDRRCLGLQPATIDIWRGMMFVHPDVDVGAVGDWFGEVEPYLGPHNVAELVEYKPAANTYEIRANWKIVVENNIDVYHLSRTRTQGRAMYDHTRADYGFIGPHFMFWEPLTTDYLDHIEQHAALPLVLPEDQVGAWMPMLFPGLGLSEAEFSWTTFHIIPLAPNLTRVETRTRVKNTSSWEFHRQSQRSTPFWMGHASEAKSKTDDVASVRFSAQAIDACEHQQQALCSPHFSIGASAQAGERPVRDHQQIVLSYLKGSR